MYCRPSVCDISALLFENVCVMSKRKITHSPYPLQVALCAFQNKMLQQKCNLNNNLIPYYLQSNTVRSIIICYLDKDDKKIQYKIYNTNIELYCVLPKIGKLFYTNAIAQRKRFCLTSNNKKISKKTRVKGIGTPVFNTLAASPLRG